MDLRAEHNSRNVSSSATPSFLASKSTNGPSRRPEKDIVRKVSGSKARVHGRRNPVQSDLTAQTYEHKRGRVRVRDKVKLERRRDELNRLRREEPLRRKLESKYIKDGVERKAEEDRIRLLEEPFEWELKLWRGIEEREEKEREKRIIEEDRASLTRERHSYDLSTPPPYEQYMRGVRLETSFGLNPALQYQADLDTYRPSRDVRTTSVTQGSPPPPANFRFAHYDPAPSRPAYKSQQQSVPSMPLHQDSGSAKLAYERQRMQPRVSWLAFNNKIPVEMPLLRPYAAELGSFELPPPPVHKSPFSNTAITPQSAHFDYKVMDSSGISQQRVSSASRLISPWTVPPTTTIKAQEGMHGTYKKERQKADRSRSNHNQSNKKGPFVLRSTISMDDTQNEVSRKRTQFIALGSASQ
jgi:hypothetical protein